MDKQRILAMIFGIVILMGAMNFLYPAANPAPVNTGKVMIDYGERLRNTDDIELYIACDDQMYLNRRAAIGVIGFPIDYSCPLENTNESINMSSQGSANFKLNCMGYSYMVLESSGISIPQTAVYPINMVNDSKGINRRVGDCTISSNETELRQMATQTLEITKQNYRIAHTHPDIVTWGG